MDVKINKIAGYRAMLGLTQEQMGAKLGISKQQYSPKERGKLPFNDREKQAMKDVLLPYFPDITIDEIFFEQKVKECK
ncbi:helix-turn-helix transcriptional regulator [Trichococcus sp.]|uniref:helix-turn-helix transcriptional regulator n=1 Tax=Trichococcus sp. TaxID=1985464 RepID=UPI003C7ACFB0